MLVIREELKWNCLGLVHWRSRWCVLWLLAIKATALKITCLWCQLRNHCPFLKNDMYFRIVIDITLGYFSLRVVYFEGSFAIKSQDTSSLCVVLSMCARGGKAQCPFQQLHTSWDWKLANTPAAKASLQVIDGDTRAMRKWTSSPLWSKEGETTLWLVLSTIRLFHSAS